MQSTCYLRKGPLFSRNRQGGGSGCNGSEFVEAITISSDGFYFVCVVWERSWAERQQRRKFDIFQRKRRLEILDIE
jgi:hypothetical protein